MMTCMKQNFAPAMLVNEWLINICNVELIIERMQRLRSQYKVDLFSPQGLTVMTAKVTSPD